ncbi:MAG TPA: Grx4 family monothiol glutaredoxin [Polyangiaceae bacterium]|jgi:monothiol glutaredoxin|nr:Grx4 family monothiol glutaredoxin [Polyangiaceae bacterium]
MDQQTRERIQSTIDTNNVVLFMKGTPQAPRCGFSATVIQILDSIGTPYATVDVLSDPGIRDGIKEFSDWPTIPQLYVKKEFVGGCDIVKELYGSGELEEKLGGKASSEPVEPPRITVTERAAKALKGAVESETEGVRFEIDGRFNYGLSIGDRTPSDIVVESGGVTLLLDKASAKRASGTTIDYVETPQGAAFKIDNPNEPPKVRQMTPKELAARFNGGEKVELLDVRTTGERETAKIEGSRFLDHAAEDALMLMPKTTTLVFHCHHGGRSQSAAEHFLAKGFRNVYNLAGGIDAWSVEVDPRIPRY